MNRLYKQAMLRFPAEFNVLFTGELRNATLVEFVEYAPRVDEDELARLTRRGAQAWKDVPDAPRPGSMSCAQAAIEQRIA